METWFLNHVLGLSLSVLLLAPQGLLGAGTPGSNSTDAVTAGISSSADELNHTEKNRTSALYSSDSLSPSQRDVLLSRPAETHTAAAGSFGANQSQPYTEMSTRSMEALRLSTEPLTSAAARVMAETRSKNWKETSDSPPVVSWEAFSWMQTDTDTLPQGLLGESSSSVVHTDIHSNSTFSSTTISRAGERTLLSVTSSSSNSSSPAFTEDTMSHQPHSTWGISAAASETEDYTPSGTSSRTDFPDPTEQNVTQSFEGIVSESTGRPAGTRSIKTQPNVTQHQHSSTSEETSESTPPLSVSASSTSRPEPAWTSSAPVTSYTEASTNFSIADQEIPFESSTDSSTGIHFSSTQRLEGTEMVTSKTSEQTVSFSRTTGPPAVSTSTPEEHSVADTQVATEVVHTSTLATATERYYITEENTLKATTSTTLTTATTSPPPPTSSSWPSKTIVSSIAESVTEAAILHTVPSTSSSSSSSSSSSTLAVQSSAAALTPTASSSQSHGPSTRTGGLTDVTTLRTEASTHTPEITTAERRHVTTTSTRSAATKITEAVQTTRDQTDAGTTTLVATPPPYKSTKAQGPPSPPRRNPCASNPCVNGGMCVSDNSHQFTCHCLQAWTGPTCSQDVDECQKDPCPVGSNCVNTRGSFDCECPLGFDLEAGRTCARAKTFLGTFSVNRLPHGHVTFRSSTMHEIQREIIQLLNASLSVLRGYSRSLLSRKEEEGIHISAVNMFSISTDVTSAEVFNSIQMSISNCSSSVSHCRVVLLHQLTYHMESLCVAQKTQCDTERSTCTDSSGTARCQCLQGYYKHNPDDLACLECGDGYKLENGTCTPCMFGFGGFNCGNFYKLIAVVVSPAGGALLLILLIALAVTCRRKGKNDLNKIIFKSGDLQMSPYADFPKSNRTSLEWGRETIEMQENGSTKNLLQMSDIYYSPVLRNADLERNGLYQFTGPPGSRHSCIYPAQWNPSFISDDSRRRDYF